MQPGLPAHGKPRGDDAVWRAIRDLQTQLREMVAGNAGQAMQVGAGGILVNDGGRVDIDGGGAAYVNGLKLSAVQAATAAANSSGSFGVNTTFTTIATAALNVPAGYSTAVVFATCQAEATCDQATGDYFYAQCMVTASSTNYASWNYTGGVPAQSNTGTLYGFMQYPQTYTNMSHTFTGLNGGTLTAVCQIKSQNHSWAVSTQTGGTVTIQAIFLA